MSEPNQIALRDRVFRVKYAEVAQQENLWTVEIETEYEVIDGENWEPRLYHQGLNLPARSGLELQGQSTSWVTLRGEGYSHPELGIMYVFGHHDVHHCKLSFGKYKKGEIELVWEGLCDVFWDDEFSESVPFRCTCAAIVRDA